MSVATGGWSPHGEGTRRQVRHVLIHSHSRRRSHPLTHDPHPSPTSANTTLRSSVHTAELCTKRPEQRGSHAGCDGLLLAARSGIGPVGSTREAARSRQRTVGFSSGVVGLFCQPLWVSDYSSHVPSTSMNRVSRRLFSLWTPEFRSPPGDIPAGREGLHSTWLTDCDGQSLARSAWRVAPHA